MQSRNASISFTLLSVISVIFSSSPSAHADSLQTKNETITDCRILRVIGGRVIARIGDESKSFDLVDVERVEITGLSKLTEAEDARAQKLWPRASALYIEAGHSTSRTVQMLTQARLIRVLDERGQWADAIKTFLKIYATEPGSAAWALRPVNLPEEKSIMLPESAKLVEARMQEPAFQSVQAQRHMKQLLVDIYLQMNDPRAATLARQLQQGVDGEPVAKQTAGSTSSPATQPASQPAGVDHIARQIEELLVQKKYPEALAIIDTAIDHADGTGAAQLTLLRGDVLAASGQNDDALMVYIRIPAMSDSGTWGGAALLKAADLQKKLSRNEAADRLYREVIEKYPDTLWAKEAQKKSQ